MATKSNVEYGDAAVALPNEILRSVVGSGVHGIAIAGTDDHDEMGVYIEPPERVVGLATGRPDYIWRTQPEGVRSGHDDTDLVLYSLRKFLRLAIKGNPTVLLPLYAPEHALQLAFQGQEIACDGRRAADLRLVHRRSASPLELDLTTHPVRPSNRT